jgi:hypothetical protein
VRAGSRAAAGVAAVTLTVSVTLAGCSSGGSHPGGDPAGSVQANTTACSSAAKAVELPAGFPAGFPLPPGTVITAADDRGTGGIVLSGVTAVAFTEVLAALQKQLPAKGFTPKDGETEPHDAESDWTSTDYDGRWAIREIPQCPGDTSVSVVARHR